MLLFLFPKYLLSLQLFAKSHFRFVKSLFVVLHLSCISNLLSPLLLFIFHLSVVKLYLEHLSEKHLIATDCVHVLGGK